MDHNINGEDGTTSEGNRSVMKVLTQLQTKYMQFQLFRRHVLFCPMFLLKIIELFAVKVIQLNLALLGVQCKLRIQSPDVVTRLLERDLLSRFKKMATESEGYETMTEHSSDIMSEV